MTPARVAVEAVLLTIGTGLLALPLIGNSVSNAVLVFPALVWANLLVRLARSSWPRHTKVLALLILAAIAATELILAARL